MIRSIPWRVDETGCPSDGNRRADWCPPRSCAAPLVNLIADSIPVPILELVRWPAAPKCDQRWKFLGSIEVFSREDQTQSGLRQRAEGSLLLSGEALGPLKKVVGDFNGRLHNMATHIRMDGHPYQAAFPNRKFSFVPTAASISIRGGTASRNPHRLGLQSAAAAEVQFNEHSLFNALP